MNLVINDHHHSSYGGTPFCKISSHKHETGKYRVPIKSPMAEDLTRDVSSLSKTERSGSFLAKTVATSSAFVAANFLATDVAKAANIKDILDPVIGGSLLLTYTTGYVASLLLASIAGALQSLLSFRKFSAWINPTSGALLLGGEIYTLGPALPCLNGHITESTSITYINRLLYRDKYDRTPKEMTHEIKILVITIEVEILKVVFT